MAKSTKKPVAKAAKPAKKSSARDGMQGKFKPIKKAPPKPSTPVPKVLKLGTELTEKQLRALTDKKGVAAFIIKHTIDDLASAVAVNAVAAMLPGGYAADDVRAECYPAGCTKQLVAFLVRVNVIKRPEIVDCGYGGPVLHQPIEEITPPDTYHDSSAEEAAEISDLASQVGAIHLEGGIAAVCRSTTSDKFVVFDALPYYDKAADELIVETVRKGYKDDAPALYCDGIAGEGYDGLNAFRDGTDNFTTEVDKAQFLAWVEKTRPHLLEKLAQVQDEFEAAHNPKG